MESPISDAEHVALLRVVGLLGMATVFAADKTAALVCPNG